MSNALPPDTPPAGDVPPSDPEAPAASSTPSWRSWLIAGLVAAAVAGALGFFLTSGSSESTDSVATGATEEFAEELVDPGSPSATGDGPTGGGAFGTVTAVEGSTLTVETQNRDGESEEVIVETDDETEFLETVEGSVSDLAEGDDVVVIGESTDSGVEATSIAEGGVGGGFGGGPAAGGQPPEGFEPPADGELPEGFEPPADGELPEGVEPPEGVGGPGGQGGPATSGTITAIDGSGLTVETEDGETVTITFDDDTTVSITEQISIDDLAEGDEIQAQGETGDDGAVSAEVVRVGSLMGAFPGGGVPGGAAPGASDDGEEI